MPHRYLIGDLQGCDAALARLLDRIDFSPSRDTLYLLGDLVNRGPSSLGVLRRLHALGDAARCLLGNHDLSLLAVAAGVRTPGRRDTIDDVLGATDRAPLLDWLRHRALAIRAHGLLMVHAGVPAAWSADDTLARACEVERALRGGGWRDLLATMWGDEPRRWSDALAGADRLRFIVNALTRMRVCDAADGALRLDVSGASADVPPGVVPWFDAPGRRTAGTPVAFGHWSQLGLVVRPDLFALDTGCVWGGCLTALRLADSGAHEVIQVACEEMQTPH